MQSEKPTTRIGDILVQCGLLSPEDLQKGLDFANRERMRLGEALVQLGLLNKDKVSWALGVQFHLSYIYLDEETIDWNFLAQLPLDLLKRITLLPMMMINETVHAVIGDPTIEGRV